MNIKVFKPRKLLFGELYLIPTIRIEKDSVYYDPHCEPRVWISIRFMFLNYHVLVIWCRDKAKEDEG